MIKKEGLDISKDEIGVKGKSGILKSQTTRQAFLTSEERKIRFLYIPKHSSWLNQIEIWFSVVVRRVLKRGNFPSREFLRQRLLDFIDYCLPDGSKTLAFRRNRIVGPTQENHSPHDKFTLPRHNDEIDEKKQKKRVTRYHLQNRDLDHGKFGLFRNSLRHFYDLL